MHRAHQIDSAATTMNLCIPTHMHKESYTTPLRLTRWKCDLSVYTGTSTVMIIAWSVVHKAFDQLLLLVMIINKSCKWAIDPASCARRRAKQTLQCRCVGFLYTLIGLVALAAAWKARCSSSSCLLQGGDRVVVVAPQLLMSRRPKLHSQLCV